MGEFYEGHQNVGRKNKRRMEAVRAVVPFLTKQVLHEPQPYTSNHYKPVEAPRPPEMLFIGLDSPREPTLWERWTAHANGIDRPVSAKPLPDITVVRDTRFDVDI